MPKAFVTGGSGFLGGHILKLLCANGFDVRALVRPTSCYDTLKSLPIEFITGDLKDSKVVRESIRGCDFIFHTGADYRLWVRDPAEMYLSNVKGTRNVLQAAKDFGASKVVYTSTVGTIGLSDSGAPAHESSFLKVTSKTGHYKRSKFEAEQIALEFAREGLPIVIVNPSAPVGTHDWKPTPTGRIVQDFLNRKMPMYMDTGLNIVDVEDVAQGHLLAAEKGRHGERYILGSENLHLKQILDLLAEMTHLPSPQIRCPFFLALITGWCSETLTRLSGGNDPRVPLEGVNMARKYMFFDCRKAKQELGYHPKPARLALRKAAQWFLENGYVKNPLPILRVLENTQGTDLPALEPAIEDLAERPYTPLGLGV